MKASSFHTQHQRRPGSPRCDRDRLRRVATSSSTTTTFPPRASTSRFGSRSAADGSARASSQCSKSRASAHSSIAFAYAPGRSAGDAAR
jgi:hypothetical protein